MVGKTVWVNGVTADKMRDAEKLIQSGMPLEGVSALLGIPIRVNDALPDDVVMMEGEALPLFPNDMKWTEMSGSGYAKSGINFNAPSYINLSDAPVLDARAKALAKDLFTQMVTGDDDTERSAVMPKEIPLTAGSVGLEAGALVRIDRDTGKVYPVTTAAEADGIVRGEGAGPGQPISVDVRGSAYVPTLGSGIDTNRYGPPQSNVLAWLTPKDFDYAKYEKRLRELEDERRRVQEAREREARARQMDAYDRQRDQRALTESIVARLDRLERIRAEIARERPGDPGALADLERRIALLKDEIAARAATYLSPQAGATKRLPVPEIDPLPDKPRRFRKAGEV